MCKLAAALLFPKQPHNAEQTCLLLTHTPALVEMQFYKTLQSLLHSPVQRKFCQPVWGQRKTKGQQMQKQREGAHKAAKDRPTEINRSWSMPWRQPARGSGSSPQGGSYTTVNKTNLPLACSWSDQTWPSWPSLPGRDKRQEPAVHKHGPRIWKL